MELTKEIYKLTSGLPENEKFALAVQMNRCAVSIPSNIAEGSRRSSRKDFKNFLTIAFGSGAELETQLILLRDLGFYESDDTDKAEMLLLEIMKMLNSIRRKLS